MTEPTSPELPEPPGPCPTVPEPLLKWLDRVVAHPEVSWDQLYREDERLAVAYDSGRRAVVAMLIGHYQRQQEEVNPGIRSTEPAEDPATATTGAAGTDG